MNILFFTPCLKASAIGRVSSLVVAELQRLNHKVFVVRTENPTLFDRPSHEYGTRLIGWNQTNQIREKSKISDLIIYQVGDNFMFHQGCVEWLPIIPGLISLHDNFLGHLFWSFSEIIGRPRANDILANFYGDKVAQGFFNHADSASFINYASEVAPMTEWIAGMASGVIVHSTWAMDRIIAACNGPVEVVSLPYDAPYLKINHGNINKFNNLVETDDYFVVLTIGHVNTNKRHSSIIEAIGSSSLLRERVCFRIVGAVEKATAETLRMLADKLDVRLVITGEVDNIQLASEIHEADAMCCLRWPALEAASASTIEAMLYGKPVIVTDTGFYRDLPDDCVLKISPHHEVPSLRAALEHLAGSPAECNAMAKLAKRYASATFRADYYAERIVAMKSKIDQTKLISNAAQEISLTLTRWGGLETLSIIESISNPLVIFR
jgi:glycosyltransferase involved in cell wall biosynthesis